MENRRFTYKSFMGDYGWMADPEYDREKIANKLGKYEDLGEPNEIKEKLAELEALKGAK